MAPSRATCVHCVVKRAATRAGRRCGRRVTLSSVSTQSPFVAMHGPDLYALVSCFFRDTVESFPASQAVRVRIVSDAHPEVHILMAAGAGRETHMRSLRVSRYADDSILARGFVEV